MTESYGIAQAPATTRRSVKKAVKMLDHMRVSPRMGGGVTVEHHFKDYEHKPEPHQFGPEDGAGFHAHMSKHTGLGDVAKAENEDSAEAGSTDE